MALQNQSPARGFIFPHLPQASVHTTGGIVGSVVCGPLVSMVGQRRAILITSPFILASWLTIWATSVFSLLVSAR